MSAPTAREATPTGPVPTAPTRADPFAEQHAARGIRFLHALNPLAKLAAPLPFMVALVFTRGFAIPLAFIVLVMALLLVGARLTPRGTLALDEPTFGQDRERAAELLDMLRALNRQGTTVLIVTHDLQLVADYANRIVVMRDGRILGAGATAEVLAGPLIDDAGLRHPPLARATRGLANHPEWHGVSRMSQLPAPPGAAS